MSSSNAASASPVPAHNRACVRADGPPDGPPAVEPCGGAVRFVGEENNAVGGRLFLFGEAPPEAAAVAPEAPAPPPAPAADAEEKGTATAAPAAFIIIIIIARCNPCARSRRCNTTSRTWELKKMKNSRHSERCSNSARRRGSTWCSTACPRAEKKWTPVVVREEK